MFQKAIYVSLKNNFIAKNCYPSSEPSASCNLFAGGGSCLNVDDYWLIPDQYNNKIMKVEYNDESIIEHWKYDSNEKAWNIVSMTKMWYEMRNAVGEMALIDLLITGLLQTFSL